MEERPAKQLSSSWIARIALIQHPKDVAMTLCQNRTGTEGSSQVMLEDRPTKPERLSNDVCFQVSVILSCRASRQLPIKARLQVAAHSWVGSFKRQVAQAHGYQDPPYSQRSHLKPPGAWHRANRGHCRKIEHPHRAQADSCMA